MSIINQIAGRRVLAKPFESAALGRQDAQQRQALEVAQSQRDRALNVQEKAGTINGLLQNARMQSLQRIEQEARNKELNEAQLGMTAQKFFDGNPENETEAQHEMAGLPGGISMIGQILKMRQPSPDTRPAAIRTFEAVQGMDPALQQQFADFQRSQRQPGPTVNVNNKAESAEAVEMAKLRAQGASKVIDAGTTAQQQIPQLQLLRDLASTVETGGFQDRKIALLRAARGVGLDIGDMSQLQDAEQFLSQQRIQLVNRMAEQKGVPSDRDAQLVLESLPQITNTREANLFMLDASIALAERDAEAARFAEQYLQQNGKLQGWRTAWTEEAAAHPIFTRGGDGEPVFYRNFRDAFIQDNPGATEQDARNYWRQSHAGRR